MPELPEVECVRRTLAPDLADTQVISVSILRKDVVILSQDRITTKTLKKKLLEDDQIHILSRHGKNLFFEGRSGRVLCVHLGMTGQFLLFKRAREIPTDPHIHCVWKLKRNNSEVFLCFRDPRRFGGLRPLESKEAMRHRISHHLGPDALTLTENDLALALKRTRRSIKVAILDQGVLAGVGNIYADEALFAARIHPLTPSNQLRRGRVGRLADCIRYTLESALVSGGSTISSYRDPLNQAGQFQHHHLVYGRGGEPCDSCGRKLRKILVAQRTTVFCPKCQRVSRGSKVDLSNHKTL